MLRLNSDWNVRGTDMVAVRMIEQQRQAIEVMADLIDSFLTIAEPEIARAPALLTDLASRSAGRKLRVASATPEPCAEEWSTEMVHDIRRGPPRSARGGRAGVPRAPRPLTDPESQSHPLRVWLPSAG
jgi:hypothetical protein